VTTVTSDSEVIKAPGESLLYYFNFTDILQTGETIATLTSILEITTTALTISEKAIVLVETTIDDVVIAANAGVLCRILGGLTGVDYNLEATVLTNTSNIRVGRVVLQVREC